MIRQAVGWDLHRKFSKVTLGEMSEEGQMRVVERARLEHDAPDKMLAWLKRLPPGMPVAVEAAFGWPWVADLLEKCGLKPHLAHPPATRELAKHEAKTDRCDADRLAKFQLRGTLPESYLATSEVRQIRERTRARMALSKLRSGLKNRVAAILHRLGVLHGYSDLFGRNGRKFLENLKLPEASREVLDGYLRLLDEVQQEIDELEQWMEANLKEDEVVQRLKTIPGIGLILAHVIRAEIGEIERFPSRRHLGNYAGLAPLSDDTAERHGTRHCSMACNHVLRWALIEAASGALRSKAQGVRLKRLHARLTRGGTERKNQAKVAVAREVAQLVFVVWTKKQPYMETPPARPGAADRPHRQAAREPPRTDRSAAAKKTKLSDQPRHPMVRRERASAGQTAW